MNQFGNLYSQYYDLLYKDKDYIREVDYIYDIIKENSINAKTLLDLGCGTGKHAELFCEKGFTVKGVDLSIEMLKSAKQRILGKENQLSFTNSSIQDLNLNKKFDVVVSLFHVMSYQNLDEELIQALEVVKKHLKKDGVFIFDFWYGPAVLKELPQTRVKRLENNDIKITRIAEPRIKCQENIVDVNYNIFITDKKQGQTIEKVELHKMRYFFDTELEILCKKLNLSIEVKYEWMTREHPTFDSWNVVWILKK